MMYPRCNLYNNANEVVIALEVPGFRKEDLDVSVSNGTLIVSGVQPTNIQDTGFAPASFAKSWGLQREAAVVKSATYRSGILSVVLLLPDETPETEVSIPIQD